MYSNDGTSCNAAQRTNQVGRIYVVSNPTRIHYTFNGWFTEETGGTKIDLTTNVFDSATTLYAQWIIVGKSHSLTVSITTVASSIQLSITSSLALSEIGAVIRIASDSAPTKTEATASAGYVTLSMPVNKARKFSISQHYGSVFNDGITLADVLAPNTAYKLYLYFPTNSVSTATTELTGLSLTGNVGEIEFTTASLPTEGDEIWASQWDARRYVSSLDNLYYMDSQTGVVVVYFKVSTPLLVEINIPKTDSSPLITLATFSSNTPSPGGKVYFNYGTISDYSSDYSYFIIAEKDFVLRNKIQGGFTSNPEGVYTVLFLPVTRY